MRNYSQIHHVSHKTVVNRLCDYDTEASVLIEQINATLWRVLEDLATAFETPFNRVNDAFMAILDFGEEAYTSLCSAEYRVLVDLHDFWKEEVCILDPGATEPKCTLFSYTNLNRGITVSWLAMVV